MMVLLQPLYVTQNREREIDNYILQFIEENRSKITPKLPSIYSSLQNATDMKTKMKTQGGKSYIDISYEEWTESLKYHFKNNAI